MSTSYFGTHAYGNSKQHNGHYYNGNVMYEAPISPRERFQGLNMGLLNAAGTGRAGDVEELIDKGANVECRDGDNATPLVRAICNGSQQTIEVLLQHGANPRVVFSKPGGAGHKDAQGLTILHAAARAGHSHIIELLVNQHVSINQPDSRGRRPLSYAAIHGHSDTVAVLLELNADPGKQHKTGKTAFHVAAERGHADIIEMLGRRHKGRSLELQSNEYGGTALHHAAFGGKASAVDALLRCGANVNAIDGHGRTPLILAASRGEVGAISVLLGAGANKGIRCYNGWTATDYARAEGHRDALRTLESSWKFWKRRIE